MIDILLFLLWLTALVFSSVPPLGRWLYAWIARIDIESNLRLDAWTQNLLRS